MSGFNIDNLKYVINKHKVFILIVFFVFSVFIGWFNQGVIIGADFQYRSPEHMKELCHFSTWNPLRNNGSYTVSDAQLSKYPFFLSECILGHFGSYAFVQRVVWLFPFLLIGLLSIYSLLKYLYDDNIFIFFGSTFYLLNATILERIQRAHIWMSLVYAISPLIMLFILKLTNKKELRGKSMLKVITGLLFGMLLWVEPRVAVLVISYSTALYIYSSIIQSYKYWESFKNLIFIYGVMILLNLFWILPLFIYPPMELYPQSMKNIASLIGVGKYSGSIAHSMQLFPLSWQSFYLPTVAIAPIVIVLSMFKYTLLRVSSIKEILIGRCIPFLLVTLVVLMFLGKGTYEPIAKIYIWMELNIPLFIGYRMSNKFLLIAALPFSILFGYALAMLKNLYGKMCLTKYVVGMLGLLVIMSHTYFVYSGYIDSFAKDASVYKNEPNMFYPLNNTEIPDVEIKSLYDNLNYTNTLTFPKVNRYRFATTKHTEVLSEDSVLTGHPILSGFFNLKSGLFYKQNPQFIANFLYWSGVNNILVNSRVTPDWNYTRQHDYLKLRTNLSNKKDIQYKQFDTYIEKLSFSLEDTASYNASLKNDKKILYKINTDQESSLDERKSNVLKMIISSKKRDKISVVVTDINGVVAMTNLETYENNYKQEIFVDIDNLSALKNIEINGIYYSNTVQLLELYITTATHALFAGYETTQDVVDVLNVSEIKTDSVKYDYGNNTIYGVEDIANSIFFDIDNTRSAGNKYNLVLLNLRIKQSENIIIEIIDKNQENIIYDITPTAGVYKSYLFKLPSGIQNPTRISIKNVYVNNILEIQALKFINKIKSERLNVDQFYVTKSFLLVDKFISISCENFQLIQPWESNLTLINSVHAGNFQNKEIWNLYEITDCNFNFQKINTVANNNGIKVVSNRNTKKIIVTSVPSTTKEYMIVFRNRYNPYWELSSVKNVGHKYKHINVNNNENGWIIDDGNTEFVIEFTPQRWFYLGLLISGITFISLIGYLLFNWYRSYKNIT